MRQMNNNNLLDGNIKKATNWFTRQGLQLPKLVQTILVTKDSVAQTDRESQEEFYENIQNMDRDYTDSTYDQLGEAERIQKEKEIFKNDIDRLKERLALERTVTGGTKFNENRLDAVAGHLRKIANSTYAKDELVKDINDVYTYIITTEQLVFLKQ